MTSSMNLHMTGGQRILLDILQSKLWSTILLYAKLSQERLESNKPELLKLKERIRRISARQKRFTLEIIKRNGNNSIPKESFFEALGLVTKEALIKLNSKTNERRRRTTANPRFSHEAIQAKRALEPRFKDNKRENVRRSAGKNNQTNAQTNSGGGASNSNNNSAKASNRDQTIMLHNEDRKLIVQFENLQKQINSRVGLINDKRESNKKLEKRNELIKKRNFAIMSAINNINPPASQSTDSSQLDQSDPPTEPNSEPSDLWIDLKCEESLDGLD